MKKKKLHEFAWAEKRTATELSLSPLCTNSVSSVLSEVKLPTLPYKNDKINSSIPNFTNKNSINLRIQYTTQ